MPLKLSHTAAMIALILMACQSPQSVADEAPPLTQHDDRYRTVEEQLPGWIEAYDLGSISVTLIENEEIAWTQIVGEQDDGVPANEETLYGVASLTKPIMAQVIMRLASEGQLDLDEPMRSYYTDTNLITDERRKILTPRMLLQHQGGFPNWRSSQDGVLKINFDPGTDVQYSGEGFDYLVRFLERKFKKRFEVLAQEYVFDPIGMKSSSLVYQPWFEGRRANRKLEDGTWRDYWSPTRPSGANDLSTTTEDYARFVIAAMKNEGLSEEIIREKQTITIDEVSKYCVSEDETPLDFACPDKMGFGLSWYLYQYGDHQLFTHTGSNWGEKSMAIYSPDRKSGLVIAINGNNGYSFLFEIASMLYDNPDFIAFARPD